MIRQSLLLGVAVAALAGTGHAQTGRAPSREDLLDALTRHIQICSEISDSQGRLACFDKLQTQVGGVQPSAPTPTPLRPATPAPATSPQVGSATPPPAPPTSAPTLTPQPLTPPPLAVPGGGPAQLGASGSLPPASAPPPSDPDAAYDPRRATTPYQSEAQLPKPQPVVRRSGPRPVPTYSQPMPLFNLLASDLTYNQARYWQITVTLTSNTARTVDAQIQCSFLNAGRPVGDAFYGPTAVAPGEQIVVDLSGPPTTVYVDQTTCRLVNQ